ncbi:hypothetical protein B0H17DRAFT_1123485 [Mycena rosella]|uniref:Uncharacterized protein n=1 Tax=Mycena rosella TaxID=1033263 RepID=A0AAD7H2C7_MYCRO|nr:hypothetical protein B0H17DRAFT_1123485 [Mycena rosella]
MQPSSLPQPYLTFASGADGVHRHRAVSAGGCMASFASVDPPNRRAEEIDKVYHIQQGQLHKLIPCTTCVGKDILAGMLGSSQPNMHSHLTLKGVMAEALSSAKAARKASPSVEAHQDSYARRKGADLLRLKAHQVKVKLLEGGKSHADDRRQGGCSLAHGDVRHHIDSITSINGAKELNMLRYKHTAGDCRSRNARVIAHKKVVQFARRKMRSRRRGSLRKQTTERSPARNKVVTLGRERSKRRVHGTGVSRTSELPGDSCCHGHKKTLEGNWEVELGIDKIWGMPVDDDQGVGGGGASAPVAPGRHNVRETDGIAWTLFWLGNAERWSRSTAVKPQLDQAWMKHRLGIERVPQTCKLREQHGAQAMAA